MADVATQGTTAPPPLGFMDALEQLKAMLQGGAAPAERMGLGGPPGRENDPPREGPLQLRNPDDEAPEGQEFINIREPGSAIPQPTVQQLRAMPDDALEGLGYRRVMRHPNNPWAPQVNAAPEAAQSGGFLAELARLKIQLRHPDGQAPAPSTPAAGPEPGIPGFPGGRLPPLPQNALAAPTLTGQENYTQPSLQALRPSVGAAYTQLGPLVETDEGQFYRDEQGREVPVHSDTPVVGRDGIVYRRNEPAPADPQAAVYQARPGIIGKALSATGLVTDYSGERAHTGWQESLDNTLRGISMPNMLQAGALAANRLMMEGPRGLRRGADAPEGAAVAGTFFASNAPGAIVSAATTGVPRNTLSTFLGRPHAENLAREGRPVALRAIEMAEDLERRGIAREGIEGPNGAVNQYIRANDPELGPLYRPAEGGYMVEIPNRDTIALTRFPENTTMGEVLLDPAIYRASPNSETMPVLSGAAVQQDMRATYGSLAGAVGPVPPHGARYSQPGYGSVHIGRDVDQPKAVLLHELQHHLDREAGLTRGANLAMERKRLVEGAIVQDPRYGDLLMADRHLSINDKNNPIRKELQVEMTARLNELARHNYERNAAEVRADLVAGRAGMDAAALHKYPPRVHEDMTVPRDQQILGAPYDPIPPGPRPVDPNRVVRWLREAGVSDIDVQPKGPDGTLYIKFTPPDNPLQGMRPRVRVPTDAGRHGGRGIRDDQWARAERTGKPPQDIANVYDTGTFWREGRKQEPATTTNAAGGSFAEWQNLVAALKWRLSRAPDGQWLVSPDQAPIGLGETRARPTQPRNALADPGQAELPLAAPNPLSDAAEHRGRPFRLPERTTVVPQRFGASAADIGSTIVPNIPSPIDAFTHSIAWQRLHPFHEQINGMHLRGRSNAEIAAALNGGDLNRTAGGATASQVGQYRRWLELRASERSPARLGDNGDRSVAPNRLTGELSDMSEHNPRQPVAASDFTEADLMRMHIHHGKPAGGLQYFPAEQLGGFSRRGEGLLHYLPYYSKGGDVAGRHTGWRVVRGFTPDGLRTYLGPNLADELLAQPLGKSPNAPGSKSHQLRDLQKFNLGEYLDAQEALGKEGKQRAKTQAQRDAEWNAAAPNPLNDISEHVPPVLGEINRVALRRAEQVEGDRPQNPLSPRNPTEGFHAAGPSADDSFMHGRMNALLSDVATDTRGRSTALFSDGSRPARDAFVALLRSRGDIESAIASVGASSDAASYILGWRDAGLPIRAFGDPAQAQRFWDAAEDLRLGQRPPRLSLSGVPTPNALSGPQEDVTAEPARFIREDASRQRMPMNDQRDRIQERREQRERERPSQPIDAPWPTPGNRMVDEDRPHWWRPRNALGQFESHKAA